MSDWLFGRNSAMLSMSGKRVVKHSASRSYSGKGTVDKISTNEKKQKYLHLFKSAWVSAPDSNLTSERKVKTTTEQFTDNRKTHLTVGP